MIGWVGGEGGRGRPDCTIVTALLFIDKAGGKKGVGEPFGNVTTEKSRKRFHG